VITAEGELQASEKLAQAAEVMTGHPAALQLRLLQTVVEVAAEKNSTLVLPFPVELLRFLERATPAEAVAAGASPEAITDPLDAPTPRLGRRPAAWRGEREAHLERGTDRGGEHHTDASFDSARGRRPMNWGTEQRT
jgi:hypothetical protein